MAQFSIVGIGSSAGGLEPLQQFFRAMPADSGLAFIVAAHLDPTRKSHLSELLDRCTSMPVVQIETSVEVEPDHVYVIAPDQELTIRRGVLHPSKPGAPRGHRYPVDLIFRSLADDQGERAIGIILSGTGTNGSLGLRFIKAEGGIAIAQDPDSASFEGMPRAAIATGMVDLVLTPDRMPEALLGLSRHAYVRAPAKAIDEAPPADQLKDLLALVRARTRQDFTSYRKGTLLRRIHRRMGLQQIDRLPDYMERLQDDPREIKALATDLTINVTGFFRDRDAWEVLADKVIAPLVRDHPDDSAIRVWVPGCSTGEEAFSIAMLVVEQAQAAGKTVDLRIFASDVIEGSLASARAGTYPGSIAHDVSPERLQRFFEVEDDTYRIKKPLREMVTFAPQNLLQDPPFSRLDLVSCRNLMIYLEPDFQKRVVGLFHFALREGGYLFLGSAESISSQDDLFHPVSKKWRIYQRLGPTRHDVVDFPLVGGGETRAGAETGLVAAAPPSGPRAGELMDKALLERYAPASALIDPGYRVHYLRGQVEDYLRPPSGEPSQNLLAMAREGLQTPLRMAVRKSVDDDQEVTTHARVRRGSALYPMRLVVVPLRRAGAPANRLLVSFFERDVTAGTAAPVVEEAPPQNQLQAELEAVREDLRLTIEQMEAANEELRASNEEIRSMNEELQSANEELETSKEELQSLNEELNTVNAQLEAKLSELEQRTDDLNNLLNSTDIATLFLDRSLCIRWFTPAMKTLLELNATDLGRPVSHFAQRFSGDLLADARSALSKLQTTDSEVESDQGRWYVRHMLPYRTATERIDGVVGTFADITDRKHAEQEVQAAKEFAESIVDTVRGSLIVLTPELVVLSANHAFYRTFGVTPEQAEGRPLFEIGGREWDIPELRQRLEDILSMDGQFSDFQVVREFPGIGRRTMLLNARRLEQRQLILLAIEDITERRTAEVALEDSEERYRTLFNSIDQGFCTIEMIFDEQGRPVDYRFLDVNAAFERQTGLADAVGKTIRSLVRKLEGEWFEIYGRIALTGKPERFENPAADLGRYYEVYAFRVGEPDERKVAVLFNDISERKRAEQERELLAHELSHRVKNTLAVVQALAMRTDGRLGSVAAYREAFVGRLQALARAHDLLLESQWQGADLKALIAQALAAYRVDHPEVVEVEGPSIAVTAKQALGLNLVLHELGTNAAKYGALSCSEGRVRVSWRIEAASERRVRLRWQERHGPAVEPAADRGFGTRLIERASSYELEGTAELHYASSGLSCELVFPLA